MSIKPAVRYLLWIALIPLALSTTGCSSLSEDEAQSRMEANTVEADRQMNLGDLNKAKSFYADAQQSLPDDVITYIGGDDGQAIGICNSLQQHGAYSLAIDYLNMAIKNPKLQNDWRLYDQLADAQDQLGLKEAEKATYAQMLKAIEGEYAKKGPMAATGDPSDYLWSKASAEWGSGDHKTGRTDFLTAIEEYPQEDVKTKNSLAYFEADANENIPESLKLAQEAVAEGRADPKIPPEFLGLVLDTLAWAEYRAGQYDLAAKDAEEAVGDDPREPVLQYHLGMIYYAQKNYEDALIELNRSLYLNPENPDAKTAIAELKTKAPNTSAPNPTVTAPLDSVLNPGSTTTTPSNPT